MKFLFSLLILSFVCLSSLSVHAQTAIAAVPAFEAPAKHLFLDVHQLEPGKVKYEDVAKAHVRDLAVEKKYGTDFLKFWVNEEKGQVYCLVSAYDTASIRKTHAEAHGLLPAQIYAVKDGIEASVAGANDLFMDVHYLGAGNVTAKDVAAAHQKDLAVQGKYGVNFINYWVDEKNGIVMCLAQAKDSASIVRTHKEAHGLIPAQVQKVKQGQ